MLIFLLQHLLHFFSQIAPQEKEQSKLQTSNIHGTTDELRNGTKRCTTNGDFHDDEEPIAKRRNTREIRKPQRFLNAIRRAYE